MALSLTDISNSLSSKNIGICLRIPELSGGHVEEINGHPVCSSGGYCVVFKFKLANGDYKALRIWHTDLSLLPDLPEITKNVANELDMLHSNYFIDYKYYDKAILINGQFYPAVVMDWCEGQDLKEYISENIGSKDKIRDLAVQFRKMVKFFHDEGISHGDLQHGNIRIRPDGTMCVLDYDSMYVPSLKGKREYIKGLPSFQHPTARDANQFLSPKVDYFSETVIYLSLVLLVEHPELWTEEVKRSDNILLFDNSDILNVENASSKIFKYRYEVSNSITMLILQLRTFMKKDSIDDLLPLEEVIDPFIHGKISYQKSQPVTISSNINISDIMDNIRKGK